MVRRGGLEPPRDCSRYLLKLVRLPIPPPPRSGCYFFPGVGGAGGGVFCCCAGDVVPAGACWPGMVAGTCTGAGAVFGTLVLGAVSSTEVAKPALLVARMESDSEVTMKSTADMVVALESRVADPRGPRAVCEPIPPNAPARSAALPLCSKTTTIRNRHTIT